MTADVTVPGSRVALMGLAWRAATLRPWRGPGLPSYTPRPDGGSNPGSYRAARRQFAKEFCVAPHDALDFSYRNQDSPTNGNYNSESAGVVRQLRGCSLTPEGATRGPTYPRTTGRTAIGTEDHGARGKRHDYVGTHAQSSFSLRPLCWAEKARQAVEGPRAAR